MDQQNVCIFIDGENFYKGIAGTFFGENQCKTKVTPYMIQDNFDLVEFCKHLTKGQKLIKIYYFDARLNGSFSGPAIRQQNQFLKKLKEEKLIQIELGSIQGKKPFRYQKGVDVKLATFLIKGAHSKEYGMGYLLSSDKDFCPAIEYVQGSYKTSAINYVFFKNRFTRMLHDICRKDRKLSNEDIYSFCKNTLLKHLKHYSIISKEKWFVGEMKIIKKKLPKKKKQATDIK